MKLFRSTKNKITKDENGETVSDLGNTQVVSVHCSLINNGHQYHLRVLYKFVPNKLDISPKHFIFS